MTSPASGGTGSQYVLTSWSGSGTGAYSGSSSSSSVTMNNPITETDSWQTQYQLTFAVSPSGSGSTSPAGSNVWENAGSLGISATANSGYSFSTWSSNTGSITFNSANSASTTATISGSGIITSNFLFALNHFAFNTVASQTAGTSFSVTITAVDSYGNTITSYSGTPTLTYSAGSITPSSATGGFSSGVWTGSVTVTAAGSGVTITATDGSYTGTSNSFTVAHVSSVDHITVSLSSTTVAAPGTVTGTATAFDQYGNSWDVSTLASWSIIGDGDGGSWSSNVYTSHTAGTYTVQASYSSKTATASLTVSAGSLHNFVVVAPSSATAGTAFTLTVTAQDASGNTITTYSSSVGLSASSGTINPTSTGTSGWSSGVWSSSSVTLSAAGSITITANDGGHTGTDTVSVTAGSLHNFIFNTVGTQTAGAAFSITVTAKDAYNNTVTGYTGTPSLSYSAGSISPGAMNAFVGGVGSTSGRCDCRWFRRYYYGY